VPVRFAPGRLRLATRPDGVIEQRDYGVQQRKHAAPADFALFPLQLARNFFAEGFERTADVTLLFLERLLARAALRLLDRRLHWTSLQLLDLGKTFHAIPLGNGIASHPTTSECRVVIIAKLDRGMVGERPREALGGVLVSQRGESSGISSPDGGVPRRVPQAGLGRCSQYLDRLSLGP